MDFIEKKIKTFLDVGLLSGNKKLLWVNPDCGLKTREWSQVGPSPHPPVPGARNEPALPSHKIIHATGAASCHSPAGLRPHTGKDPEPLNASKVVEVQHEGGASGWQRQTAHCESSAPLTGHLHAGASQPGEHGRSRQEAAQWISLVAGICGIHQECGSATRQGMPCWQAAALGICPRILPGGAQQPDRPCSRRYQGSFGAYKL